MVRRSAARAGRFATTCWAGNVERNGRLNDREHGGDRAMKRNEDLTRRALLSLFSAGALGASAVLAATPAVLDSTSAQYKRWIVEMKEQPRGPFSGIKWFCRDGRVLAAKDFACAGKGQGWQHGEWSDRTRQVRAQGYLIANLLAGLDVDKTLADPGFADAYAQWLVEKFLIATDDGWILRKAQYYRGAVQEEDERDTARRLLIGMASQPAWIGHRFVALRTGARLLPHGADGASAQKVRNMAAALNDRDPSFEKLRIKIHNSPEATDAEPVRAWAASAKDPKLAEQARELAAEIDRVYAPRPFTQALDAAAKDLAADAALKPVLQDARTAFAAAGGAEQRLAASAALLRQLRDVLPQVAAGPRRLGLLDLSLAAESEHFRAAVELRSADDKGAKTTRAGMIARLKAGADASYGAGLIGARERAELDKSWARFVGDEISLSDHLAALRSLGLLPAWASQTLRQHFGEAMDKLASIEPAADLFIQDQLRGSPLLAYSQGLDALSRDANRAAGVQHRLLGREIGAGFTALNPGLARGVLYANPDMKAVGGLRADGIYLLPETVSELPPVAGILTAGAGNPLSHVQLLARNLGIPNVAVDPALLPELRRHDGKRIVLAVSPAGLVEIHEDGPKWDAAFGTQAEKKAQPGQAVMFAPDLSKLDLKQR